MIWLSGAIFNIVRYVLHQYTERKLLVQAAMVDHPYKEEIQDIIRKFEIENFKITILPGSISPAISGIRSPIFVFPDYKFSPSDLRYILKHEIIHYQKHDAVPKLFLDLCVCTFWWNPLLYICRRNFLLSIEIANDMWLIRDLTEQDKLDYATCLLDNGKRCYLEATRSASIAFIHKRSDLKLRIMKILQKEKRSSRLKYLCHNVFLVLLLITGCLFVGESASLSPEVKAETFTLDEENSYLVQTEDGYDL